MAGPNTATAAPAITPPRARIAEEGRASGKVGNSAIHAKSAPTKGAQARANVCRAPCTAARATSPTAKLTTPARDSVDATPRISTNATSRRRAVRGPARTINTAARGARQWRLHR